LDMGHWANIRRRGLGAALDFVAGTLACSASKGPAGRRSAPTRHSWYRGGRGIGRGDGVSATSGPRLLATDHRGVETIAAATKTSAGEPTGRQYDSSRMKFLDTHAHLVSLEDIPAVIE